MLKTVILLLSFLPLALQLPYLFQAWSSSRLDHWDWIFYLSTIPAAVWAVWKIQPEKIKKCDFYALFLLIPVLCPAVIPEIHHINALAVAASVVVVFSTVWLLYSWQLAYRLLPVAVILLLGTPSSSYQLSLLLMCKVSTAWAAKFILAILSLIWIWSNRRFALHIKRGTVFFLGAVLVSCMLLLHTGELYFEGQSFIPEFPARVGKFRGRNIQPDENTKRFFVTGTVRQYRYTGENGDIAVLAVKCGRDIHEIHPASHCLRTSLWTVNTEKILYLQDNFAVTEIDAQKGGTRLLVWVWYSSDKFSTPGFLGFRRHFQSGGNYHTYQISIPVTGINADAGRRELQTFLQALKQEIRK